MIQGNHGPVALRNIAVKRYGETPPLAAEELYVRRMVLANDALDRTYERFPPAVLARFAQTLPGKPVLIAHDKSELPIGAHVRCDGR